MQTRKIIECAGWCLHHPLLLLCRPVKYLTAKLRSRWFRNNPRRAELLLGMALLGIAVALSHLFENHLIEWGICEPLKAIGGAPIARALCEAMEWEA